MSAPGYAIFDSAIGWCGIAWSAHGVVAVQLPEARPERTRARLLRRVPGARELPPPPAIAEAIAAIVSLLGGTRADLGSVPVDMSGVPDFERRVYELARTIPPGSTLTYGEIARRLGAPESAQAVGRALGRNPFAIVVPCHRVLAAGNKPGGFSATGGVETKLRLLGIEGAPSGRPPDLFDSAGISAGRVR